MARVRTIAAVGVSAEETAHLRMLLGRSADRLEEKWKWGDEQDADLLVVDPAIFAGQMARTRALAAGMRVAIFSDRPDAQDAREVELVLHRPLLTRNVIEVLNQISEAALPMPEVGSNSADFYTRDLGEDTAAPPDTFESGAPPVGGLDRLLDALPAELRYDEMRHPDAPAWLSSSRPGVQIDEKGPSTHTVKRAHSLAEAETHPLTSWLDGDLLRAPAWLQLEGAPQLALDPKNRVVLTAGTLSTLVPYCHARWAAFDWQPLTSVALSELREAQATLSYESLLWLHALEHAGGRLAAHLDPAGTYRLLANRLPPLDREPLQRIAAAMAEPLRVHEIAAWADVAMDEVFSFITASEAVGAIEWRPRQRPQPAAPGGLLRRLRKPFDKS